MGITIDVESVVYPRSRARAETLYKHQPGWKEIEVICETLGWDKVPWEDPSEQQGTCTSANYSRYYLLQAVAHDFDRGVKGSYERFPHLLEYDDPLNASLVYMPVELPYPIHVPYEYDINYTVTLIIASAPSLSDELEELEPLLRELVAEKGAETRVTEYRNSLGHTWGGVYSLCQFLQSATKNSYELNLPICVSG